jgi:hypothetical protein
MDSRHSSPLDEAYPSPGLRERVLGRCRREMEARAAARRHRQRQWRWSTAAGVLGLLLLNVVENQRSAARIDRIIYGHSQIAKTPRPRGAVLGSLRARTTLLVALLRDPNSL